MKAPLDQLRSRIVEILSGESVVAAAYLYGSVIRGGATLQSDVDVALVLDEELDATARGVVLRRLNMHMRRACPGAEFDLRCLDELPVAVAGRVVTEGTCVFERDPAPRVAAEVRARMLYHDFLPFERRGFPKDSPVCAGGSAMVDATRVRALLSRLRSRVEELGAYIANHVIAAEGYRAPTDYADAFRSLRDAGVIGTELSDRLEAMPHPQHRLEASDSLFVLSARMPKEGPEPPRAEAH